MEKQALSGGRSNPLYTVLRILAGVLLFLVPSYFLWGYLPWLSIILNVLFALYVVFILSFTTHFSFYNNGM